MVVEGDETGRLSLPAGGRGGEGGGKKIRRKGKQGRTPECGKGAGLRPTPEL